jgi:hypothetical protein
VALGAEDSVPGLSFAAGPLTLVAALFPLGATPEREHHGAFLDALAAALPPATPLAVLVDDAGFTSRFGPARRDERRAGWRRMLAEHQREPVFVDLEQRDFDAAQSALRAALDAATVRG